MNHMFNVEIAEKYGLNEAIILENLYFWVKKNVANGQNYHDGNYWTYNSVKAFANLFPYMSSATIRRVLAELENLGLIVTGNYNKRTYDRTKWYALTELGFSLYGDPFPEAPDMAGNLNQNCKAEDADKIACPASEPVPAEEEETAINPKPKRMYTNDFEAFWNVYPRKKEKAAAYKNWLTRLKDGYSPQEIISAAGAYASQCMANHTEERFIKQAKTFLGPSTPFTDFLQKTDDPAEMAEAVGTGGIPSFAPYA